MTKARKCMIASALGILTAMVITLGIATPANATSQTCIGASGGYVCTIVYGNGSYVDSVGVSRGKAPTAICNYSAWFFRVEPSGKVYGMGSQSRAGCVFGRAWFHQEVRQTFPRGTQMCAKFYENHWSSLIGQKCVGLS